MYRYVLTKQVEDIDMESHPNFDDLNARLQEIKMTPEYQADLQWLQGECQGLENLAHMFLSRIPELSQAYTSETVRVEYATGSTLRRGFYCPSPVFELIVGNTKRGKISHRKPATAKHWHMYGFNRNNNLLWCREYYNGNASYTEHLIYENSHVYAVQAEAHSGRLSRFTDEFYEKGQLTKLMFGMFGIDGECQELLTETYQYDNEGIVACTWHSIVLPPKSIPDFLEPFASHLPRDPIVRRNHYTFHRENGLVCGYSSGNRYYKIKNPRKI